MEQNPLIGGGNRLVCPYEMGKIFILMQDDLGDERLQKLLPYMSRVGSNNFIIGNKQSYRSKLALDGVQSCLCFGIVWR
jgi:hypothetical protein